MMIDDKHPLRNTIRLTYLLFFCHLYHFLGEIRALKKAIFVHVDLGVNHVLALH